MLGGVALAVVALAVFVYTPWGNRALGTAPLPPEVWAFLLPFAGGMLALEELRKAALRRLRHRGNDSGAA